MSLRRIPDHEILYRRIPPGETHFQPPSRITSANFKLRRGELGLSVYRKIAVDLTGVLKRPEAIAGSRIAQATVGQIRSARNSEDTLLGLDVVATNDENDPGHAEIRGPKPGLITSSAAKTLSKIFKLVDLSSEQR